MEVKTQLRHLRMAPRKVRLVVNAVRGLSADAAVTQLRFMKRLAAVPVRKLIESGVANAEQNNKVKSDRLWIKSIMVGDGLTLKRWKPRAMGRAVPIRKRASHVVVVLTDKAPSQASKVMAVQPKSEPYRSAAHWLAG
jgi:large subunit ribosomal protein L22